MDYQAEGVLYLPLQARFSHLLTLTEGANLGSAIATAMELVEAHNPELQGVLPRGYNLLPNATLVELLRLLAPLDLEGDAFGKVYEYFLGNFALKEGQKGGVFYTPTSIVRLIVEILQPFHGRIFDPACGSGGMFVQSAAFVQRHQKNATARTHRVRHREGQRHRQAGQDEPGGARPVRRHPRGQHLLRRPAQGARPLRLRDGQSAVQRLRRGQGPAEGRPALRAGPAEHRQRQLPVDPALRIQPERERPRRLRDGQLGRRRARQRAGDPQEADPVPAPWT